ncbi:hypothetical protein HID58_080680, partial [Brassica napus]
PPRHRPRRKVARLGVATCPPPEKLTVFCFFFSRTKQELSFYPRQIMPRQSELRFERFQFFTGDKPTKPRASAIDVKETVNDDMCTRNHEFAVTARALVICTGVQENGKLPTENEPKIGLSLQNVRTVKVCLSLFPNIYLWRVFPVCLGTCLPNNKGLLRRWCSYNVQWLPSSQFLSRYIHNGNSYDYRRGRKVIHCRRM